MNGRDLYSSIYGGERPGRLPVQGMSYWEETLERWRSEGLKNGENPNSTLNLNGGDTIGLPLNLNLIPPFPIEVLETDSRYVVLRDEFSVTKRMLRCDFERSSGQMAAAGATSSMSQWLDFPVKDLATWKSIYENRLRPSVAGRLPQNWNSRKADFVERSDTRWVIHNSFPLLGLFGPIRELMGYEGLVYAMKDQPELIHAIVKDLTDFWLETYSEVLCDVRLDEIIFFEDMCSTRAPLISPEMFATFFAPGYRKAIRGLREMAVRHFFIDSDGDLRKLIPELLLCGLTGTHPCEINAGMNPAELRENFPTFCLNGGIDKRVLARDKAAIDEELKRCFQTARVKGRYTPTLDHGVPPDVSWNNMLHFAQRYREFCESPGQLANALERAI